MRCRGDAIFTETRPDSDYRRVSSREAALFYLLLAFLSTLWGSSFLLIAIAARGFDPLSFAMVRVAIGAWALAARGGLRWPPRGLWGRLALMSAFGQAIQFLLIGDAAHRVAAANSRC